MRRIMQIRKDVIDRDLHNFSYHTTTEFNNSVLLFIQNIFHFLTSLLPWLPVDFLLNFGLFFVTVLGYTHRFAFLQILLKKQIVSIEQYVLRILALRPFSFTVEPLRNGHLGGQKKVTVVERFEKGSMYVVSAKKSGRCSEVARLVEVRLQSQHSTISSSGSLS